MTKWHTEELARVAAGRKGIGEFVEKGVTESNGKQHARQVRWQRFDASKIKVNKAVEHHIVQIPLGCCLDCSEELPVVDLEVLSRHTKTQEQSRSKREHVQQEFEAIDEFWDQQDDGWW